MRRRRRGLSCLYHNQKSVGLAALVIHLLGWGILGDPPSLTICACPSSFSVVLFCRFSISLSLALSVSLPPAALLLLNAHFPPPLPPSPFPSLLLVICFWLLLGRPAESPVFSLRPRQDAHISPCFREVCCHNPGVQDAVPSQMGDPIPEWRTWLPNSSYLYEGRSLLSISDFFHPPIDFEWNRRCRPFTIAAPFCRSPTLLALRFSACLPADLPLASLCGPCSWP
mmetsp:Transcript_26604/g.57799  ORF Transcript_26604/g.57799 Transcript_26604/m.57799 type:complete len:226 (-) Transcript_26604:531-1208(-)